MKKRIVKFMRNVLIAFFVLLIILLIAGAVYTWYMGQNSIEDNSAAIPVKVQPELLKSPTKPPVDAKVGVSVQMLTTPIKPGSNASVTVKTNPDANCTVKAVYNKIPSIDSGLSQKVADEYGMVTWTWSVEASAPLGKWPVTITCANSKYSGVVVGDLVITNQIDE